MKKIKAGNNFATILSSLVMILLVAIVVGFLYSSTNNFTTNIQTFYVRQDNLTITKDYDNFEIIQNKEYVFEVNDPAQSIKGEKTHFSAKVYYNYSDETAFDYMVDENTYCSSYLSDLTQGFEIEKDDGFFTFTAKKDLPQIIELLYPSQSVSNCPSVIDTNISYFTLQITSTDTNEQININLILKSE